MAVESPSDVVVPSLAPRLSYIMEEGSPAEPEVIAVLAHILQNLHRMVVIVLVGFSVAGLYLIHCHQFRQDEIEQSGILQIIEAAAGMLGEHNLVHLVADTLATDNLQPFGIARESGISLIFYLEIELGSKTYTSHHTERVVRKGDIRIERSGNDAILQVIDTIKRIDEFAKTVLVQADRHSIDGEVATVLVILQGSILYNRLARITVVTLLSCSHELYFCILILNLCGSEISEHRKMCLLAQLLLEGRSHLNSAPHHHDIDVIGRALQEEVAHISTYYIAFHRQRIRRL